MQLDPDVTALLAVVATALSGVLLLVVVALTLRLRRIGSTYRTAVGDDGPGDLLTAVADQRDELARLRDDVTTAHDNIEVVRGLHRSAISRVGVVRYDAFPDMGGMLSFSAALLDERGDGLVVSSINGRQETRAYGKPLSDGGSEYNLSDEEQAAVQAAMEGGRSGKLTAPTPRRRRNR